MARTPNSIAPAPELGQRVGIRDTDLYGIVTGILLDNDGLQYRVAYWLDGIRRVEWVFPGELAS